MYNNKRNENKFVNILQVCADILTNIICTMGVVVMSIEEQDVYAETTENSLDQYGVWVKKQPKEILTQEDTSISEELDIENFVEEDSVFDIFTDDLIEEKFDGDFDIDSNPPAESAETDLFDNLDATLTTDELLNITNEITTDEEFSIDDISIEEEDFPTIEELADNDIEDTISNTVIEESSENTSIDDDLDFDLDSIMNEIEDVSVNFDSTENEEDVTDSFDIESIEDVSDSFGTSDTEEDLTALFMTDDAEVSIDDFLETEEKEEQTLDIDVVFEENQEFIEQDSIFDEAENSSIDLEDVPESIGEEISIEDIPESESEDIYVPPVTVEEKPKQDFNLNVDPETNNNPKKEEETTPVASTETNALLSQIVAELANLRNEFNSFKTELDTIKSEQNVVEKEIQIIEKPCVEEEKSSGFFGDDDGDDTIALSDDELNNLLTSADFSFEDIAETEESESTDDTNESFLADTEMTADNIADENTIDEIEIDEGLLADEIEKTIEDTVITEPFEDDNDSSFDDFDYLQSVEQQTNEINTSALDEETIIEEFNKTSESIETEFVDESELEEFTIEDFDTEIEDEVETTADEPSQDEFTVEMFNPNVDLVSEEEQIIENEAETFEADISFDDSEISEENDFIEDADSFVMQEEELVEPSLDNIDYEEDPLPSEIEIPIIEDLVVDSSSVSFFEDEEQKSSSEIDDTAMRYLADEPETDTIPEIEETVTTEECLETGDDFEEEVIAEYLPADIKDEDVIEEDIEPDITSPVKEIFESEQWSEENEEPIAETIIHPSEPVSTMKDEIKSVLTYMDRLLESLPEEKITEFAQSEYFDRYKKLFNDLGIS